MKPNIVNALIIFIIVNLALTYIIFGSFGAIFLCVKYGNVYPVFGMLFSIPIALCIYKLIEEIMTEFMISYEIWYDKKHK